MSIVIFKCNVWMHCSTVIMHSSNSFTIIVVTRSGNTIIESYRDTIIRKKASDAILNATWDSNQSITMGQSAGSGNIMYVACIACNEMTFSNGGRSHEKSSIISRKSIMFLPTMESSMPTSSQTHSLPSIICQRKQGEPSAKSSIWWINCAISQSCCSWGAAIVTVVLIDTCQCKT